jgi:hypothetical protein
MLERSDRYDSVEHEANREEQEDQLGALGLIVNALSYGTRFTSTPLSSSSPLRDTKSILTLLPDFLRWFSSTSICLDATFAVPEAVSRGYRRCPQGPM